MYCPVCATESSTDRKFCRNCGADLQLVIQALNGLVRPLEPDDQIEERKKRLFRKGGLLTWGGFMFVFTLAIIGVAMNNFDGNLSNFFILLSAIGNPVIVTGAAMMIYARYFIKAPDEQKSTLSLSEHQEIVSLPGPKLSVTEHTTELLETAPARIHRRDTAPQND